MFRSMMASVAGCALLLAAASPCLALELSVLPAQPHEGMPFTLVIALEGSCPQVEGRTFTAANPRMITFQLIDSCLSPGSPQLLEVPIEPLASGTWYLRAQIGKEQETLRVDIKPLPYAVELDPPNPQVNQPFTVRFTGSGVCEGLRLLEQDGRMITFLFTETCAFEPLTPGPFELEEKTELSFGGDFVVQVVDIFERTLASRRFHASSPSDCAPSETALCLLQGRYRVEATWRTATAQGIARAHPEAANFGAFSLADPEHLELFVGMRDACATEFQMVWVYTAGLTDAEVEFIVTEVATGEVRRYPNQLGMQFVPMLDAMAFVCP